MGIMDTQSIKSPTFLIMLILIVLAVDIFALLGKNFRLKNLRYRWILFLNILFPVEAYLAFTDQQDESYIWASKVSNFLTNGHLGVLLYDDKFGESSVSTAIFLLASAVKKFSNLTIEQSLYVPNILAAVLVTIVWQRYAEQKGISRLYFILPLIFLLLDYGFILCLSASFDVGISILFCLIILIIFLKKGSLSTYSFAILIGFAEWIRSELLIFKLLYIVLVIIYFRREIIGKLRLFTILILTIIPTLTLLVYKYWAFGGVTPAMIQYKKPQLDAMIYLRGIFYLLQSIGVAGLVTLLLSIVIIYRSFWRGKRILKIGILQNPLLSFENNWVYIGIAILYCAPIYAGADYYGAVYQRYILTPLFLTLIIACAKVNDSKKSLENLEAPTRKKYFTYPEPSFFIIVTIMVVAMNSFFSGVLLNPGISVKQRPARATCDQLLGPEIRSFWSTFSSSPLVIATSEANGIAFSSSAKLLDLSGIVDSRNYPAKYEPVLPGNLYGKYKFDFLIQQERPSIIWPPYSEHCSFFNPIVDKAITPKLQLNKNYSSIFSRYWFPTESKLKELGYCPKEIRVQNRVLGSASAAFYYNCVD